MSKCNQKTVFGNKFGGSWLLDALISLIISGFRTIAMDSPFQVNRKRAIPGPLLFF
jgi:hypothetical protein